MPNCPNCGTWNPEDKTLCWRCQTELPRPEPPKKKRQNLLGFPIWMWVFPHRRAACISYGLVGNCTTAGIVA